MLLTVFQEVYSVHVDPRLKGSELNKNGDLLIRKCGFKSLLQEAFTLLMQLLLATGLPWPDILKCTGNWKQTSLDLGGIVMVLMC